MMHGMSQHDAWNEPISIPTTVANEQHLVNCLKLHVLAYVAATHRMLTVKTHCVQGIFYARHSMYCNDACHRIQLKTDYKVLFTAKCHKDACWLTACMLLHVRGGEVLQSFNTASFDSRHSVCCNIMPPYARASSRKYVTKTAVKYRLWSQCSCNCRQVVCFHTQLQLFTHYVDLLRISS